MSESVQLTAEVFIDTGKDFRPEDSLTVPYTCALGCLLYTSDAADE